MASSHDKLERELRTVERLIETIKPDAGFVEDLLCLELHRKALSAALAIERDATDDNKPFDIASE